MCRIVIVCVNVRWILHFTLHNHRLRVSLPIDALLVITGHMKVLKQIHMGERQ